MILNAINDIINIVIEVIMMSKFEMRIDTKKIERQLQKQLDSMSLKIAKEQIMRKRKENGNMFFNLSSNDELLLDVFIEKYNEKNNFEINGNCNEFPDYMKFSIKDSMNNLKLNQLISHFDCFIDRSWYVVLTPDALKYYEWKGSRTELYTELASSDKKLLNELIELDSKDENITEYLKDKVNNDKKDIIRGIIGNLKSNGLLSVSWASDTIVYAKLTQSGRTFFEREEEYYKRLKDFNSNKTITIETINAENSNIIVGDVIDSNIILNNTLDKIESEIDKNCKTEKEKRELTELLNETKEIIDDFKETKQFSTRKSFYKKLFNHFSEHSWFYAEIVNLLGQVVLMKVSGQI